MAAQGEGGGRWGNASGYGGNVGTGGVLGNCNVSADMRGNRRITAGVLKRLTGRTDLAHQPDVMVDSILNGVQRVFADHARIQMLGNV